MASTTEWLLAKNAILKLELQQTKAVLESRKAQAGGKRLVLKGKIIINTDEILKAIEEAEAATQAKRPQERPQKNAPKGKPQGRPQKNAPAMSIVTVIDVEADDRGSESNPDL